MDAQTGDTEADARGVPGAPYQSLTELGMVSPELWIPSLIKYGVPKTLSSSISGAFFSGYQSP